MLKNLESNTVTGKELPTIAEKVDTVIDGTAAIKEQLNDVTNLIKGTSRHDNAIVFQFSVSFANPNIDLDMTTEENIERVLHSDYCSYTRCKAGEWTATTQNCLMKWYATGGKDHFIVVIKDERIKYVKKLIANIEAKLADDEIVLSPEEQVRYNNYNVLINLFTAECQLKEMAIVAYLKDKAFQSYFHVNFHTKLHGMINEILNLPNQRVVIMDDEVFSTLELFSDSANKKYKGSFRIDISNKFMEDELERRINLNKMPLLGVYVCDWDIKPLHTIAAYYYVNYVSKEILTKESNILDSNEYLEAVSPCIIHWRVTIHSNQSRLYEYARKYRAKQRNLSNG